jgi:hypothetical protein
MNSDKITEADITAYLKSIEYSFNETVPMKEDFMKLNNTISNDFKELTNKQKEWYQFMFSRIHNYKMRKQHSKLKVSDFDIDVLKYTNNEKLINTFRNGYKLAWLSFSAEEKMAVVERFEFQFANSSKQSQQNKEMKESKIDSILKSRKKEKDVLVKWTDGDILVYDDNKTIVEHVKEDGIKVTHKDELTESDLDSLFDDK